MARNANPPPAANRPFRPAIPVVIGLTGGVAAGKSTVAKLFAAHGLAHIDADQHAREVAADPAAIAAVRATFGDAVMAGDGLDRGALAQLVFADAEARRRLEAILHPRIRAQILAELEKHKAAGTSVLLDAPLLHETGLVEFCDFTVFVAASYATRGQRARDRGWAAGELERREQAQLPLAVKKQRALHTIDNDGEFATTARKVAAVIDELAFTPE